MSYQKLYIQWQDKIRSLEDLHNQHNEADTFRVMKRRATDKDK